MDSAAKQHLHNLKVKDLTWFITKAKAIHGDSYDYTQTTYDGIYKPITIICPLHGVYIELPRNHLRGKQCPLCGPFPKSPLDKLQVFIRKAQVVHENIYDYSQAIYKDSNTPLTIICKKHGSFHQRPSPHLAGAKCFKCAKEQWNSEYNIGIPKTRTLPDWILLCKDSSPTLYILHCYNEQESFLKVGITKNTIQQRYPTKKAMPYNYSILYTLQDSPETIWTLERRILEQYRHIKYIPQLKFKGMFECITTKYQPKSILDALCKS